MDFLAFVTEHLPPAPARVLEIGCGTSGGLVPSLRDGGYDALGIDPRAPEGGSFRQETLEQHAGDGYDAVVAGRVLHHVEPLAAGLDKLVSLAPLLLVDEFAWNHIDGPTQEWYEGQHRMLAASGAEPGGPASLDEWRWRHAGLHPYETLREGLDARYDEVAFELRPYLYRWLGGPSTRALEETLVGAGAIRPLGWLWAGRRR